MNIKLNTNEDLTVNTKSGETIWFPDDSGTLYIKPDDGIPKSDLADGIVPFICALGDETTVSELDEAIANGQICICRISDGDIYDYYPNYPQTQGTFWGYLSVEHGEFFAFDSYNSSVLTFALTQNGWQAGSNGILELVTNTQKSTWNSKYTKPSSGIPASDLAAGVIPSVPVQDVTVGGTSVVSNGTAVLPTIPEYYDAIYDVTTSTQLKEAHDAGNTLRLVYNDMVVPMVSYTYTAGTRGSGGGGYGPEPPTPQAAYLNVVFETTYGSTVYTFSLTGVAGVDTWSTVTKGIYEKPSTGIPASDLASGVIPAPEIFWVIYGTTTAAEIDAAVQAGKEVLCLKDDRVYQLVINASNLTYIQFFAMLDTSVTYLRLKRSNNAWDSTTNSFQKTSDRVTAFQSTPDNTHYPSEKLVKDSLDAKQDTLVSGTNIKTINNQSLLGSGDIAIQDIFVAQIGYTTYADVLSAYNADKTIQCYLDNDDHGTIYRDQSFGDNSGEQFYGTLALFWDDDFYFFIYNSATYEYYKFALTQGTGWIYDSTTIVPDRLSQLISDSTHRTVTDAEKATWNSKYTKPASGIPASDLSDAVKYAEELEISVTLDEQSETTAYVLPADFANIFTYKPKVITVTIPEEEQTMSFMKITEMPNYDQQDHSILLYGISMGDTNIILQIVENAPTVDGKRQVNVETMEVENTSHKVTTISSSSDDMQYPSAKCVYDAIQASNTPEIFWATYGTTTAAEVKAAYDAGKVVVCNYNNAQYRLTECSENNSAYFFQADYAGTLRSICVRRSDDLWYGSNPIYAENTNNRRSSWQTTPDNTHYPSEKLVKDYVDGLVGDIETLLAAI